MLATGDMDFGAPVLEIESAVVVDVQKFFIEPQDRVYGIYDTTESDKAWSDSYITWTYEPIVVDDESSGYD